MGSSCCRTKSPCGSAEERSGLLKNDQKAAGPTVDAHRPGTGTCGPEGEGDIKKTPAEADMKVEPMAQAVQAKHVPEVTKTPEANNTQENKPSTREGPGKTDTPSPGKGSGHKEENSTRAQDKDVEDRPAGDSGQAEPLHCTLNVPQDEHATAQEFTATNAAPKEREEEQQQQQQIPASVQEKIGEKSSPKAQICPENHTETNTTEKHIASADTVIPETDEGPDSKVAAVETTAELSQNIQVLSVPDTRLSAGDAQVSTLTVSGQENHKEPQSCAVPEDSQSSPECKEASCEVTNGHVLFESPTVSKQTALDHSAEQQQPENCTDETETTSPTDASQSSKCVPDAEPDLECATAGGGVGAATSAENIKQDISEEIVVKGEDKGEDGEDAPRVSKEEAIREREEGAATETEARVETEEGNGEGEQLESTDVKPDEIPVTEKEGSEDGLGNSEEDLYRGAEELSVSQKNRAGSPSVLETTLLKVEDRCSLAPAMDILTYSEREWKGNTAKSALIRKGYKEMSQRFGSLRRVRGDNYCALRATLFQVFSHSTHLPSWLQDDNVAMLPGQLEAQEGLISQWTFPGECLQGDGRGDVTVQLKGYMELLRNKWQAAVDCSSAAGRQQLCERVFRGGEEELGLLEALKLLMLGRAVELHSLMQAGGDVPLFCWLLFARDSSDCPRSFLSNHLRHVGLSAGLEQVEMFLLGYALQCTIQVYRLYKADTEEFITFYPDDHKDEWPCVCLVTEDDRHYNVPVVEPAEHVELTSS